MTGNREEYKILYFNNENKIRFFKLDFAIPKLGINVEFNGSRWHYNIENEEKNNVISFKENAKEYEILRYNIVSQNGFKIFKVWDYDVTNEITEIEMIEKLINEFLKIKIEVMNETPNKTTETYI